MKLAITSTGESLQSSVDPRFGRAEFFVLADAGADTTTALRNSMNLNAAQGAGIQAAKTIIDLSVQALITGHVGPKAFAALKAGGVAVYPVTGGTVAEAIDQFKSGTLHALTAADVEGHW